jgi:hypothetical protein
MKGSKKGSGITMLRLHFIRACKVGKIRPCMTLFGRQDHQLLSLLACFLFFFFFFLQLPGGAIAMSFVVHNGLKNEGMIACLVGYQLFLYEFFLYTLSGNHP